LHQLAPRTGRRGIVFLLSDLLDDVGAIRQGLQHLVFQKHEVIVFHVLDAAELDFPFRHLTLFRGLEGLPDVLTDPASIRESYLKAVAEHQAAPAADGRRFGARIGRLSAKATPAVAGLPSRRRDDLVGLDRPVGTAILILQRPDWNGIIHPARYQTEFVLVGWPNPHSK
jgi:hypothetical protein